MPASSTVDPRLLAYRLDPPALMKACGLEPDDWQHRLLTSTAKRIMVLASRQVGKSSTCAILGLLAALTVPRALVVLVSASHPQSKELFLKLTMRYDQLGRPVRALKMNTEELRLANGSRVLSLPANPATIRGYSDAHTIICDEAALMMDAMFTAVSPMRAVSHGKLILVSTAHGQRGYYWDQWEHGGDMWERHRITADMCPRISAEFLEGERLTMGEAEYLQEWFCIFSQATDQYFSTESIEAAFVGADPPDTEIL